MKSASFILGFCSLVVRWTRNRSRLLLWSLNVFVGLGATLAQPVITEFMASNGRTLADEDGDFEDWVEIHNPDTSPISLSGWYLTDRANDPTKWMFPAVTVPARGYLVVFASSKNRTDPNQTLHTNFGLSAGGEYLGLVRPDGVTVVSQYAPEFPAQIEDVSYGVAAGEPAEVGFLAEATPGAANVGVRDLILTETVEYSTGSSTFVESVVVGMSGAAAGQVIRYTLAEPSQSGGDVPAPTVESPLYAGPFEVTQSVVIKAAVFTAEGRSHGAIATIQLLRVDHSSPSSLTGFTSELPVVVLDNHGFGPMVGEALGGTEKVGWLYLFEPGPDGITRLLDPVSSSAMLDLEVRGQSSSLNPKQGFKFDLRNQWSVKSSLDLLGRGAQNDWNLVAPYQWDTGYVRNPFAYETSNAIGRWAASTRIAEAFLNQGEDGLTQGDYHGIVVLTDKNDLEPGRIDIMEITPQDNDDESITGGYLLLVDEPADNKFSWKTARGFPDIFNSVLQVDTPKIDDLTSAQRDYITDYVQDLENALHADAGSDWSRRQYLQYIDRASWVDHHILNVFFKNTDAFWRSAYFHKDRGKRLAAGPIWDFDRSMDSADPRDNEWNTWGLIPFTSQGEAVDYWDFGWWGVLATDPDFMQSWIDRWQSLRQGPLHADALLARVEKYRNLVTPAAAARDAAKWSANVSRFGSFGAEMDYLGYWLRWRADWIDGQFVEPPVIRRDSVDTVTFVPPGGARLVYTVDGADPRLRGGAIAPDALVAEGELTVAADSAVRVRAFDESKTAFPGSPWSGMVPGALGAPYAPPARLTNLSSRAVLAEDDAVVIGGFVIEEATEKSVLIRGVGPALARYNVAETLPDPFIQVFNEAGEIVASNQGWGNDAAADRIPALGQKSGAFSLDQGSADAATAVTLPAGRYTVHLRSASGQGGTGLLEVYELDDVGSALNLSVRGASGGAGNPLVVGFVVTGSEPKRLLIRAAGPALTTFGVENLLADPRIVLRNREEIVAENDNWFEAEHADDLREAAGLVGAFAFDEHSLDAALLVTVPPGVYTASVIGAGDAGGAALVEVYEVR